MTKSDYLSNSAKLLLISSALLFAVNALVLIGAYNSNVLLLSQKLSNFCFYAVFILGFLAFNGEGIGYKHSRETASKKKTTYLKILLLFAFLVRYVKTPIEKIALSVSVESVGGVFSRLFLGLLNTVSSYGFLLTMAALWYIFRDAGIKKLLPFETCAFTAGVVYNIYKIFNYTITKYDVTAFGELFTSIFSNRLILNILCLLQFAFDILMFCVLLKFYDKQAAIEQEEKAKVNKKLVTARKIYSTDCFGIDSLEDDFFLEKTDEEII